jgi:hypothetical protein
MSLKQWVCAAAYGFNATQQHAERVSWPPYEKILTQGIVVRPGQTAPLCGCLSAGVQTVPAALQWKSLPCMDKHH